MFHLAPVLVLALGIGIGVGQCYWVLGIGCLIWYRSNPRDNLPWQYTVTTSYLTGLLHFSLQKSDIKPMYHKSSKTQKTTAIYHQVRTTTIDINLTIKLAPDSSSSSCWILPPSIAYLATNDISADVNVDLNQVRARSTADCTFALQPLHTSAFLNWNFFHKEKTTFTLKKFNTS